MTDSNVTRLRTAAGPRPSLTEGQALASALTIEPTFLAHLDALEEVVARLRWAACAPTSEPGRELAAQSIARCRRYLDGLEALFAPPTDQPPSEAA